MVPGTNVMRPCIGKSVCISGLTWVAGERVGRAKHCTARLDGIKTLNDNRDNGARSHVLDQAGEERLVTEVSIVWGHQIRVSNRTFYLIGESAHASRGAPW